MSPKRLMFEGVPLRIVVVTSCTAKKKDRPARAELIYRGEQHLRLMRGVSHARAKGVRVDVFIVSAKHGLIRGTDRIDPYNESFADMKRYERLEAYRKFDLDRRVGECLRDYDLGLIALGEAYAEPIGFRRFFYEAPTLRFVASPVQTKSAVYREVAAGKDQAKAFACGLVGLKGEMAGRILDRELWDKDNVLLGLHKNLEPLL